MHEDRVSYVSVSRELGVPLVRLLHFAKHDPRWPRRGGYGKRFFLTSDIPVVRDIVGGRGQVEMFKACLPCESCTSRGYRQEAK